MTDSLHHPGIHARIDPDRLAVIVSGSSERLTYAELERESCRIARLFRQRGLKPGDHVAVILDNRAEFLSLVWAALRAGLYLTPVNWHLKAEEACYVVNDCGAKAIVVSSQLVFPGEEILALTPDVQIRLSVAAAMNGYETLHEALRGMPGEPLSDEADGSIMYYSSGTTDRPKGIKRALSGARFGALGPVDRLMQASYGFGPESVYLCPGPLYHAAPLAYSLGTHRLGGTVVVMPKFDPECALQLIEQHHVTHAQFVPTHFVRILQLPQGIRDRYSLASLRYAIHAGAPCAIDVKEAMIEWLGPVIYEYYCGSEVNGFCMIDSEEWLAHKGSVGRSVFGPAHVVGEDGQTVDTGEPGVIYFEGGAPFEYHNAPEKTAAAHNARGWSTLGDIGYMDAEGYVYLTDRQCHTINTGGVKVSSQEVENALILHPAVRDVAVIGIPDPEYGQSVRAVVELRDPQLAGEELAADLIGHCRERLAHFKCPRSVDFVASLPRLPNGKLLKRELQSRYRQRSGEQ
jgi:long-chain acyl-CoA synthetase